MEVISKRQAAFERIDIPLGQEKAGSINVAICFGPFARGRVKLPGSRPALFGMGGPDRSVQTGKVI